MIGQPEDYRLSIQSRKLDRGRRVIELEAEALSFLANELDKFFVAACDLIFATKGRVITCGLGKSGLIARKISATLSATGTPAIFVHPSEAGHGDLGMLASGDTMLVLSNSGNTLELRPILNYARRMSIPIIGIAARRNSLVMDLADVPLLLPQVKEACSVNIAPTTSTTMQLALGDALAMTVMDMRGVSKNHLRRLHPAGSIGLALTAVSDIMHAGERLPLVHCAAGMPEAISVMTGACFGLAGVVDDTGALVGVITDGDLRRHFNVLTTAFAQDVMTHSPKLILADMPAGEALAFLNENQITAAFVVEDPFIEPQVPLGIIHIHDLLRHGLN